MRSETTLSSSPSSQTGSKSGGGEGDRPTGKRPLAFIVYSNSDTLWKDKLRTLLAPAETRGLEVFTDRDIQYGADWDETIQEVVNQRADVAFLLLSSEFLANAYIMEKEVAPLLERWRRGEVRIIPILVEHCLLDFYPELTRLQIAPSPDKTISELPSPDLFLRDLVRDVLKELGVLPPEDDPDRPGAGMALTLERPRRGTVAVILNGKARFGRSKGKGMALLVEYPVGDIWLHGYNDFFKTAEPLIRLDSVLLSNAPAKDQDLPFPCNALGSTRHAAALEINTKQMRVAAAEQICLSSWLLNVLGSHVARLLHQINGLGQPNVSPYSFDNLLEDSTAACLNGMCNNGRSAPPLHSDEWWNIESFKTALTLTIRVTSLDTLRPSIDLFALPDEYLVVTLIAHTVVTDLCHRDTDSPRNTAAIVLIRDDQDRSTLCDPFFYASTQRLAQPHEETVLN